VARLDADPTRGLTEDEAAARRARFGPNALPETTRGPLDRLKPHIWGPIPWMIQAAAVLSAIARDWQDFCIVLTMLFINAGVGVFQEYKADNAIAALRKTLALTGRVLREGRWQTCPAADLVPGDIIALRPGGIVPADAVLLEGSGLSVDQSALTGESLPVDREVGDKVLSGSIARMGEMTAVVTATGSETAFGRTARLVETAGTVSHFQKAVLRIGTVLILLTLALVALIVVVALFRHDPIMETLVFALILTVAAIPVALPAVLSVTMAVGAMRLARHKAIVSRLVSIEEMASMDILCCDKTGTLTRNSLSAGSPATIEATGAGDVLAAAVLASRADNDADPIDRACRAALEEAGAAGLLEGTRVTAFSPFDPVRKHTLAEIEDTGRGTQGSVAKGAPQAIADLVVPSEDVRARVDAAVTDLARTGARALGVARKDGDGPWRYLGVLPLFDPVRADSADTVAHIQAQGISVRMLTGDHAAIARETARQLGMGTDIGAARDLFPPAGGPPDAARITNADGFAEVFPEHKFAIVRAYQDQGNVVGMTGDGVNDAPALKQADIGIAVSGATDAARAAADLVLTAPGLSVIAHAIEESRRIFERMTGYAAFRIAETIRVLLFMTLSILVFDFYPVTAAMIVLLAVLNDIPIMMIAYDNVPVAARPVRWDMPRVLTLSLTLGGMGVLASFGLFWIAERVMMLPQETIQTLIFLKLLVAGHLTVFLTRNTGAFWSRPWPSWRLVVATETTQILGTLAAVYGWFVAPIGWGYALAIWGYALVWFLVNNAAKVLVLRAMHGGSKLHARHLDRVHSRLDAPGGGQKSRSA
jgi:H+-transporting ATPase